VSPLWLVPLAFYVGGFVAALQLLMAAGEYERSARRLSVVDTVKLALLWPIAHRLGREDS
jgi:hypothetical protein